MSSIKNDSLFTLSCNNNLEESNIETMWTAFNKCKAFIENGSRFENMSWRLWQYQQQSTNYIDNKTIKRLITSIIMSPASIHDAYSHEVSQTNQKCYDPTKTNYETQQEQVTVVEKEPEQEEEQQQEEDDDYISDYDEYEDEDLYDDDIIIEIKQPVYDFKKTQPKPTTPKRSLLSDLFGRPSSPPSLLSNSTCSSISLTDDQQPQQQSFYKSKNHDTHDILNWKEESFHGW